MATIAVERWLDILALLVLTVVLIAVTPIPGEVRQGILAASVLAGLGTVGLWWAVVRQGLGWYWDTWLPRIPQRLTRAIVGIARSFVDGLAAMRSPRQALTAAFYSILAWGVVCGSTYLVLRACHLDLPWYATLLIIVMVNFGSAIPSSPGFIGVAHFLAVTALSPWAVDSDVALSFALVFHAMPFLLTLILGLGSIWWAGIAFRRMAQVRTETQ